MAAEMLRDLSGPIDVELLDATVSAFYCTGSKEEIIILDARTSRAAAIQILCELLNNPDTWLQVMHILQNTKSLNTKIFALRVLERAVKYRWNALPAEQRDCMTHHISKAIVQLSSNEASLQMEKQYIDKLNIILVQILKHEWPGRWRSFIAELVSVAKTSETICENCMAIFKLLSEEVFDFSRGKMRQQKSEELKQLLISEFPFIRELCLYVLSTSQRTDLIRATLSTLLAFLPWIPLGYIFESPLLDMLLKFFTVPTYMNLTLQCLTKVAAFDFGDSYNVQYGNMYKIVMAQLQAILPLTTDIPLLYVHGSSEHKAFIRNLALFFTSFYKVHIGILESTQENLPSLLLGLEYLINISYVDDPGVFKVCLKYWYNLVLELFGAHDNLDDPAVTVKMTGLQMRPCARIVSGLGSQVLQRQQLYACPMLKLRVLIFYVMAKLEEVFAIEDKNGNIVCKTIKDNDDLNQYEMLKSLFKQLSGEDWSWNELSILYWAVGSTSESMTEEQLSLLELERYAALISMIRPDAHLLSRKIFHL